MKILNYFDKAYYINLDSRTDRRESFETRIAKHNLEVERFSAIIPEPIKDHVDKNRHFKEGCIKSHIEIVRLAKEQGLDNVLIFEDDCLFAKDFTNKATQIANKLYNEEWDLFYLGGEPNGDCPVKKDGVRFAPKGVYQTHAYAIHKRFFDSILAINPSNIPNIDIWYIHQANIITLISETLLCIQEDGYSDNYGANVKFTTKEIFDKYVK